jgi:hypothetical protein
MNDEPVVDEAENDEPEGERELVELRRNKFVWQEGDLQIIKSHDSPHESKTERSSVRCLRSGSGMGIRSAI